MPTPLLAPASLRIRQTHPRYDEWAPVWKLLGEVAEGDGGFLNGGYLHAHPRELNYARDPVTGEVNSDTVVSEKEKFKRRRKLTRYENFAAAVLDTFVDYQYAKAITRTIGQPAPGGTPRKGHPIESWWEDVDGQGTDMTSWLRVTQVLADTYGHLFVVIDREQDTTTWRPRTRADEGRLVLRRYLPLDALDWLAPRDRLTAIKFAEATERTSLLDEAPPAPTHAAMDASDVEYRLWTATAWSLVDADGAIKGGGPHAYGEVPVVQYFARRRARIPLVGRSLLGDGRLFKDHYNVLSELRELMRAQTFSLLNIQLGPMEDVGAARGLMGDHLGTDSILWTRGAASFLAAPSGPVVDYMNELQQIERKIFRLTGLPWEGDSAAPESAGSRRLKAMDLNRLLAGHADEAERFEYQIARLWFIGTYGRDAGLAAFDKSELAIKHPDDFHTEELLTALTDAQLALTLGLGPTANTHVRQRLIPLLLPDLDQDTRKKVDAEIEANAAAEAEFRDRMAQMESGQLEPAEAPEAEGQATVPAENPAQEQPSAA